MTPPYLRPPGRNTGRPSRTAQLLPGLRRQKSREPGRRSRPGRGRVPADHPTEYLNSGPTNVVHSKPGGDDNRYDGATLRGDTAPAIYLARDTDASRAEGGYYHEAKAAKAEGRGVGYKSFTDLKGLAAIDATWLPGKSIVTYVTTAAVRLLDLRRDSAEGMKAIKLANADPGIRAALQSTPYKHLLQALQATDDYSAARAFALVAGAVKSNGVTWNTARISTNADRLSDNLTLSGEYKEPVGELRPVKAQVYFKHGRDLLYVVKPLDKSVPPGYYSSFPVGTEVTAAEYAARAAADPGVPRVF